MNNLFTIKVFRIISIQVFILLVPGFSSCDNCGDYALYYNNLTFRVLSKTTGENVMHIRNTVFNYDTVKIYNVNWEVVYPGPVDVGSDGLFSLYFIDQDYDKGLINELIDRRFFLYFNYQNVDTIDIAFNTKYNDCHYQVINYFKASYNGIVFFDSACDKVPYLDFLK